MKRGRKRGAEATNSKLGRALSIAFQVLMHGSLVVVLVAAIYFLGVGYRQKQAEVARKELEVVHLQQSIAVLQETNRELRYSAEFLQTDDGIEKVAREKLDLVRPGEVTFQVIARPTPPPRPARPAPVPASPPSPATGESWIPNPFKSLTGEH